MAVPREMRKRQRELDRMYQGFLLWAMQDEDKRSQKAVARAMNMADATIRGWRKKHDWGDRVADPSCSAIAVDLYRKRYHAKGGGAEIALVAHNMSIEYDAAKPREYANETARAVDVHLQIEAERESRRSNERVERLGKVLDGVLVKVGRGLGEGSIEPRVSDLGHVIRGYTSIMELAMKREAMASSAGEEGESVAASQRVLQALDKGGDVLEAMEQDAEEVLLIVRSLRTASEESNVVPFPGTRREAAAGGDE